MAETSLWKKLNSNKYLHAIGFLLICWVAVFRFQGTSEQRMFWIGQGLGFGIGTLVVMGVLALAFAKLRPFALLAAIYVAAISSPVMAIAQSEHGFSFRNGPSATAGSSYVSNKFITDWMSKSRLICVNRDVAGNSCMGVMQVVSVGASNVDVLAFAYVNTIKVVMPMRLQIKSAGLCYTVPELRDYAASVYTSNAPVATISAGDQLLVLTDDQRAEMWRVGHGMSGWQPGDEICSRYAVHDRQGDNIQALVEHVWKNGKPSPDEGGSTMHFFGADAKLPLMDMATVE